MGAPHFKCNECGAPTNIAQNDGYTICEKCCPTTTHPNGEQGHEYEYDGSVQDYPCKWCDSLPPHDHYLYHPDPFDYY